MSEYRAREDVKHALRQAGCFSPGYHFIVDGQFGSTGKGLMACVYAEAGGQLIDLVTTNAGPNSGHTAYLPTTGERVMTQQIPIAARTLWEMGLSAQCHLNAGAIIDPDILWREFQSIPKSQFAIHPNAAIIEQCDRDEEASGSVASIASTGKGVGAALARKVLRRGNVANMLLDWWSGYVMDLDPLHEQHFETVLVETAQGFSLGINGRFYPHTTSRECTVMQAAADARIPRSEIKHVIACYRTFPIRVGNTDQGSSGPGYSDQEETTWEAIGQTPELTSVTKRVRRVFTWSRQQFRESVAANEPTVIFLNFANYLQQGQLEKLLTQIRQDYRHVIGYNPPLILLGYGPYNGDVRLV